MDEDTPRLPQEQPEEAANEESKSGLTTIISRLIIIWLTIFFIGLYIGINDRRHVAAEAIIAKTELHVNEHEDADLLVHTCAGVKTVYDLQTGKRQTLGDTQARLLLSRHVESFSTRHLLAFHDALAVFVGGGTAGITWAKLSDPKALRFRFPAMWSRSSALSVGARAKQYANFILLAVIGYLGGYWLGAEMGNDCDASTTLELLTSDTFWRDLNAVLSLSIAHRLELFHGAFVDANKLSSASSRSPLPLLQGRCPNVLANEVVSTLRAVQTEAEPWIHDYMRNELLRYINAQCYYHLASSSETYTEVPHASSYGSRFFSRYMDTTLLQSCEPTSNERIEDFCTGLESRMPFDVWRHIEMTTFCREVHDGLTRIPYRFDFYASDPVRRVSDTTRGLRGLPVPYKFCLTLQANRSYLIAKFGSRSDVVSKLTMLPEPIADWMPPDVVQYVAVMPHCESILSAQSEDDLRKVARSLPPLAEMGLSLQDLRITCRASWRNMFLEGRYGKYPHIARALDSVVPSKQ